MSVALQALFQQAFCHWLPTMRSYEKPDTQHGMVEEAPIDKKSSLNRPTQMAPVSAVTSLVRGNPRGR